MEVLSSKTITNPVDAYFLTISKSSYDSYFFRIREFCRVIFKTTDFQKCDWKSFTYIDLLRFIQHKKSQGISPNSLNTSIAIIKSIALHAWQLGFISLEEYTKIKLTKKVKGHRLPAGRTLEINEIQDIKHYYFLADELLDIRDFAMFALGVGAGLRRKEITLLDVKHITKDNILVNGKGDKQRLVPLTSFVKQAVKRWLKVAGIGSGAVFTNINTSQRISIQVVHRCYKRIVRNVECEPFTAHDLRRTFATYLLDNKADVFAVQLLLGHSNETTTRQYDRRGEKIKAHAIKLLPF
ncbi:tyrosine-type recombinase/integrase [Thalassotalea hakodatensis]|uniref:tyrosine-type recombinase/integrase n=1 Tax=Thalassotalea hakodatensis TaxID=3030492 RepID=UPI0025722972|nr:tyrosine-type recombinase/integrase [Thalassotalea hakodatensis]